MGTRCLTKVYETSGDEIVTMYRQYDGYLEGHGNELAGFLQSFKVVNGYTSEDRDLHMPSSNSRVANGMGCLAAQLIGHFKEGQLGGFYIYPSSSTGVGEDYTYHVTLQNGILHLRVTSDEGDIFNDFVYNFEEVSHE